MKEKNTERKKKYLGGREGRIGSLSGLRGHESAAGEGSAAVEFATIHCSNRFVRERVKFEILGPMSNYIGDFILIGRRKINSSRHNCLPPYLENK